ncbi:hypothetical protein Tco_1167750 [Tanacetum coccineum]
MPIPTTTKIDVTNLAETIQMSIATQRIIEDFKAHQNVERQEDPGTRIEPMSDKESPKVTESADILTIHDEEVEEESAGDEFELRRREKGKGIEDIRDTPPLDPLGLIFLLYLRIRRYSRNLQSLLKMLLHMRIRKNSRN